MNSYFGVQTFRNFYNNLPYTGQGGMEWITKRGVFATPIVIKMLPIRDMSLPPKGGEYDDFDMLIYNVKTSLPLGAKVRAIQVVTNKSVDGNVCDIKVDHEKRRVRIFVRSEKNNEVIEVYPESIYRDISVRECASHVMSLSEYIST